jgi:DNA invertase Pin-like site-specific DNA recombinase
MPEADRTMLQFYAVFVERERLFISQWTKEALARKKARGEKFGSARHGHWDGREHKRLAGLKKARAKSIAVKRQAAQDAYADVQPVIVKLREQGKSLRAIADYLNDLRERTRNDRPWNHVQVMKKCYRDGQVPLLILDSLLVETTVWPGDPKAKVRLYR